MTGFLPSRSGRFRSHAAEALDAHLERSIEAIAPQKETSPMSTTPMSAGQTIKDLMTEHVRLMGEIHVAQAEQLRVSLERQRETVAGAVRNVAAKIDSQTDDFLAIMGQFTNDLG